jgi:hypothetical protein
MGSGGLRRRLLGSGASAPHSRQLGRGGAVEARALRPLGDGRTCRGMRC